MNETDTAKIRQAQLRELGHDTKSHLSVICMGLEALGGNRENSEQFEILFETIQVHGIEPLKKSIEELLNLACQTE